MSDNDASQAPPPEEHQQNVVSHQKDVEKPSIEPLLNDDGPKVTLNESQAKAAKMIRMLNNNQHLRIVPEMIMMTLMLMEKKKKEEEAKLKETLSDAQVSYIQQLEKRMQVLTESLSSKIVSQSNDIEFDEEEMIKAGRFSQFVGNKVQFIESSKKHVKSIMAKQGKKVMERMALETEILGWIEGKKSATGSINVDDTESEVDVSIEDSTQSETTLENKFEKLTNLSNDKSSLNELLRYKQDLALKDVSSKLSIIQKEEEALLANGREHFVTSIQCLSEARDQIDRFAKTILTESNTSMGDMHSNVAFRLAFTTLNKNLTKMIELHSRLVERMEEREKNITMKNQLILKIVKREEIIAHKVQQEVMALQNQYEMYHEEKRREDRLREIELMRRLEEQRAMMSREKEKQSPQSNGAPMSVEDRLTLQNYEREKQFLLFIIQEKDDKVRSLKRKLKHSVYMMNKNTKMIKYKKLQFANEARKGLMQISPLVKDFNHLLNDVDEQEGVSRGAQDEEKVYSVSTLFQQIDKLKSENSQLKTKISELQQHFIELVDNGRNNFDDSSRTLRDAVKDMRKKDASTQTKAALADIVTTVSRSSSGRRNTISGVGRDRTQRLVQTVDSEESSSEEQVSPKTPKFVIQPQAQTYLTKFQDPMYNINQLTYSLKKFCQGAANIDISVDESKFFRMLTTFFGSSRKTVIQLLAHDSNSMYRPLIGLDKDLEAAIESANKFIFELNERAAIGSHTRSPSDIHISNENTEDHLDISTTNEKKSDPEEQSSTKKLLNSIQSFSKSLQGKVDLLLEIQDQKAQTSSVEELQQLNQSILMNVSVGKFLRVSSREYEAFRVDLAKIFSALDMFKKYFRTTIETLGTMTETITKEAQRRDKSLEDLHKFVLCFAEGIEKLVARDENYDDSRIALNNQSKAVWKNIKHMQHYRVPMKRILDVVYKMEVVVNRYDDLKAKVAYKRQQRDHLQRKNSDDSIRRKNQLNNSLQKNANNSSLEIDSTKNIRKLSIDLSGTVTKNDTDGIRSHWHTGYISDSRFEYTSPDSETETENQQQDSEQKPKEPVKKRVKVKKIVRKVDEITRPEESSQSDTDKTNEQQDNSQQKTNKNKNKRTKIKSDTIKDNKTDTSQTDQSAEERPTGSRETHTRRKVKKWPTPYIPGERQLDKKTRTKDKESIYHRPVVKYDSDEESFYDQYSNDKTEFGPVSKKAGKIEHEGKSDRSSESYYTEEEYVVETAAGRQFRTRRVRVHRRSRNKTGDDSQENTGDENTNENNKKIAKFNTPEDVLDILAKNRSGSPKKINQKIRKGSRYDYRNMLLESRASELGHSKDNISLDSGDIYEMRKSTPTEVTKSTIEDQKDAGTGTDSVTTGTTRSGHRIPKSVLDYNNRSIRSRETISSERNRPSTQASDTVFNISEFIPSVQKGFDGLESHSNEFKIKWQKNRERIVREQQKRIEAMLKLVSDDFVPEEHVEVEKGKRNQIKRGTFRHIPQLQEFADLLIVHSHFLAMEMEMIQTQRQQQPEPPQKKKKRPNHRSISIQVDVNEIEEELTKWPPADYVDPSPPIIIPPRDHSIKPLGRKRRGFFEKPSLAALAPRHEVFPGSLSFLLQPEKVSVIEDGVQTTGSLVHPKLPSIFKTPPDASPMMEHLVDTSRHRNSFTVHRQLHRIETEEVEEQLKVRSISAPLMRGDDQVGS